MSLLFRTENNLFVVLHFSFSTCMDISMSNRPSQASLFFINSILPWSFISYALVSNIFITWSWKFHSSTYLSGMSQLNLGFSSTNPLFLYLWFSHWFGVVADWGFVSVSQNTIMTIVASCISACFTISFMLSESAILVCRLYNCYIIAFFCLHLPS